MNVVILHCHFRRGGVTQVVQNHIASLAPSMTGTLVLASGGRTDGLSEKTLHWVRQVIIDELDYDDVVDGPTRNPGRDRSPSHRADQITESLAKALGQIGMDSSNTILHWHNHSLGKNVAIPLAIRKLARQHGFRQLLQIHDFAEDFRPENYQRLLHATKGVRPLFQPADIHQYCYPNITNLHYATLTHGDAAILSDLGIERRRIHVVPNSVTLGGGEMPDPVLSLNKLRKAASLPADSRWSVYPVRGIRRKNLGEFLLLSRFMDNQTYSGITLPPTTPIELDSYRRWHVIAADTAPRAIFDAGMFADVSFQENLAASEFVLSTSVAEGFGMAFLEPWLANRGVIARHLGNVVDDFSDAGMRLNRFYDGVLIPGDSAWVADCAKETAEAFRAAWASIPCQHDDPEKPPEAVPSGDETVVDFGRLTPKRQIDVLRRMARDTGFENAIKQQNPELCGWLREPFAESTLQHNRQLVQTHYSLEGCGQRLNSIYQNMRDAPIANSDETEPPLADGVSVVDLIRDQRCFFPCRTELEIAK